MHSATPAFSAIPPTWARPSEVKVSRELLRTGEHADFTYCIGEERIPAHSQIILIRAPDTFLANMLTSPMREKKDREAKIVETSAATFRLILEFVYTGHCTVPDDIGAMTDLYMAADKYQILEVCEWVRLLLVRRLKCANLTDQCVALENFGDAQTPDAAIFKFICTRAVFRNWDPIKELNAWKGVAERPALLMEMFGIITKNASFVTRFK
ncbi:Protein CBR-bath-44 [Rhizophlyctis rosea]|uniref:Protein CBR-bath-44 n=1 Tax=Rhizophlyctis rosea TaxID=64517 RepID=A0AAD5X4Y7_9FUNG|nr:Protein CBR-bath-44 [Rhizophlyctis rosea]